jgi:hypothetical protein
MNVWTLAQGQMQLAMEEIIWWRARVKMYSTGNSMAKSLAGLIDNDNLV